MMRDSFGNEVAVGDYLLFATKTRYLGALSLGRVTKMTDSSLSMVTICTHGKTLEEFVQSQKETYQRLVDAGHGAEKWAQAYNIETIRTAKTRLADASSCFKLAAYTIPPALTQALSAE